MPNSPQFCFVIGCIAVYRIVYWLISLTLDINSSRSIVDSSTSTDPNVLLEGIEQSQNIATILGLLLVPFFAYVANKIGVDRFKNLLRRLWFYDRKQQKTNIQEGCQNKMQKYQDITDVCSKLEERIAQIEKCIAPINNNVGLLLEKISKKDDCAQNELNKEFQVKDEVEYKSKSKAPLEVEKHGQVQIIKSLLGNLNSRDNSKGRDTKKHHAHLRAAKRGSKNDDKAVNDLSKVDINTLKEALVKIGRHCQMLKNHKELINNCHDNNGRPQFINNPLPGYRPSLITNMRALPTMPLKTIAKKTGTTDLSPK